MMMVMMVVCVWLLHCSTVAGRSTSSCVEMDSHQLQLRGDVLLKCYSVNSPSSPVTQLTARSADTSSTVLFRCQFHTSALHSQQLDFSAADLDLESRGQGHGGSLDGLRVQFRFSATSSSQTPAHCEYMRC